ncbi:MAG: hypothetical protein RR370_01910 [Synergistaceae bacterium]
MFVSGMTFCQSPSEFTVQKTKPSPIVYFKAPGRTLKDTVKTLAVSSGIFDNLYITSPESVSAVPITNQDANKLEWNFHTIMLAKFKDNLAAGNLIMDYLLSQITCIRIKRRVCGTVGDWINLFDVPVSDQKDLRFISNDYLTQSGIDYEYSYSLIIGNREFDMQINKKVYSDFSGVFILDNDERFSSPLDISFNPVKNRPSEIVQTINGKYPFVISNGDTNYYTGSVSGVFIPFIVDECRWDTKRGSSYRHSFMNFLCNGKPKILKYRDGSIYIIAISDNPSESEQGHQDKIQTNFSWTQIGDATNKDDLYNNGFIKINDDGTEGIVI